VVRLRTTGALAGCTLLSAATLSFVGTTVTEAVVLAPSTTPWVRISGGSSSATQAGPQLGTARTAGGTLNVIWNRGASTTSIFDTRISPGGKILGTATVATGWVGDGGLALLDMPNNTLALFAAGGLKPTLGSQDGINVLTAPASGASWTLTRNVAWGQIFARDASYVGATLTSTGQVVTAWGDGYHVGLGPGGAKPAIYPDMGSADLATDQKTGAVVEAGVTISGQGGTYVRRLLPSPGPATYLVSASDNAQSSGVAARIGAPGVYVAWADGNAETVKLTRYLGPTQTLVHGPLPGGGLGGANTTNVFAAPGGRLWVAWWADRSNYVFVTRSNEAVSRWEPVQTLTLPANNNGVLPTSQIQGNGSTGPLDLFIDTTIGNEGGFMYTRVRALFELRESVVKYFKTAKTKTAPVRALVDLSVRDAGDPVAGVHVSVAGKHLVTGAKGLVTLPLVPGSSYTASAGAPGYAPASISFTIGPTPTAML
jgi:hypothetical protein